MSEEGTFDFMETSRKQLILQFFQEHPNERFSTKELADEINIPQSSLSRALNELSEMGFLDWEKEGKYKNYYIEEGMKNVLEKTFDDLQKARTYALERRKDEIEGNEDQE